MKYTGGINVAAFSKQDFIYIAAFGTSSFLQAIVVTIQGPSYGALFQEFKVGENTTTNSSHQGPQIPTVDANTGVLPIYVFPKSTSIYGELDFSATFFGLLLSFYQLFSFILTPIIGIYVEDIGMKKVYMFGVFVAGGSPFISIVLTLIPDQMFYLILSFILRGIEAVGGVGMQVAIYMMITVLFPGRIATIFALNQAMTVFGVATGGPIVFVIQKFGGFALPSTAFLIMGLIFTGFAFLVFHILPDLPPRESLHITLKELFRRFYEFLKVPPILLFELSIVITGIGNAFLQSILAPNLRELQVGIYGVALLPLLPSLLQILSPVWGYVLDRIRDGEIVALIGSMVCAAALVLIGPLPFIPMEQDLGLTCFGLVVFGLGQGAVIVSSYILLMILAHEHNVPDDMITTTIISTSYVAAISLGSGVSSVLSGLFYDSYGFRYATLFPFSLYAFLTLLVFIHIIFKHFYKSPFFEECLDSNDERSPLFIRQTYYHHVTE